MPTAVYLLLLLLLLLLPLQVAWVTRAGTSEMDKPIAIRPTSETVSSLSPC
jgi:hypothetical protein